MAPKPTIIAPREPLVDKQTGQITHAWFRALSGLFTNSGTVSTPLVVQPSVFLSEGTVSSGGTISSPDLPAGTLIGNGGSTSGPATTIDIDPSLLLSGEALGIAPLAAGALLGNSGAGPATPGPIEVAGNLILSDGTLTGTGSTDDETLLYSIRDTRGQIGDTDRRVANLERLLHSIRDSRGQIAALERRVNEALTLAMLPASSGGSAAPVILSPDSLFGNAGTVAGAGTSIALGANLMLSSSGTLSASGTIGVDSVVAGPGLAGGTITGTGTISLGTIAAGELLGNAGTVAGVPAGVVIGSGLTLSPAGTLASTGVTSVVVAGSPFLNAGTITSAGTISSPTLAATGLLGGAIGAQATNIALGPVFGFSGNTLEYTGTLVVAPSVFLNAGTIVGTGTISSPTLAAQSLIGNSGTIGAAASAIAVGANLTLSGGTLSATGGGGGALTIENGGTSIGTATTLNAGAGMTATLAGSVATLSSTGTGGSTDTFIYPTFATTTTTVVGQIEHLSSSTQGVAAGDSYKFRFVGTRAAATGSVGFSILNAANTAGYTFIIQNDGNVVLYRYASSTNTVLGLASSSLPYSYHLTQAGTFIIEAMITFNSTYNEVQFLNTGMIPLQDNGINFIGSTFGVGVVADLFTNVGKFQIQKIS